METAEDQRKSYQVVRGRKSKGKTTKKALRGRGRRADKGGEVTTTRSIRAGTYTRSECIAQLKKKRTRTWL